MRGAAVAGTKHNQNRARVIRGIALGIVLALGALAGGGCNSILGNELHPVAGTGGASVASGKGGAGTAGSGSGGAMATGGAAGTQIFMGTGGAAGIGGSPATGGATGTGGGLATGGTPGTGGASATGGAAGQGGKPGAGGTTAAGGTIGTGGAVATGGNPGTGGVVATGGNPGTGGIVATGGNPGTGGIVSTGGNPGTGGIPLPMKLISPDQPDNASFGTMYTCAEGNGTVGSGTNPELVWANVPAGTVSFAITLIDTTQGATSAQGQYWAIWNIPANVVELPKALITLSDSFATALETSRYLAPCPTSIDTFEFTLYALPGPLNVSGAAGTGTVNSNGVKQVLAALGVMTPLATATLHGISGPMGLPVD
jgi:phosphatidylethanolamine-binding protein (PEBP) family uncharacterized protein